MREQCKQILTLMRDSGYDVVDPSDVDTWTEEEVEYFHCNYSPHYL